MIHPYDPQAAMNAKYAAFARKNAATARRLASDPAGRAIEEAQLLPPAEDAAQDVWRLRRVIADAVAAARISGEGPWVTADAIANAIHAQGYDVTPRAPQAAGEPHSTGDGSYAASDPGGGSAGHTALRDRIRDAFHAIAPDCVAYHATDCIDCTTRADAVMADIQREFDQHWADLACRTNERDQWREEAHLMTENRDYWRDQVAKEWRQRAEAAEAALATQNAENDRLDELLIDERTITARLGRELAALRAQQDGGAK